MSKARHGTLTLYVDGGFGSFYTGYLRSWFVTTKYEVIPDIKTSVQICIKHGKPKLS